MAGFGGDIGIESSNILLRGDRRQNFAGLYVKSYLALFSLHKGAGTTRLRRITTMVVWMDNSW